MTKQLIQRGTILAAALGLWFLTQSWLGNRPPVQAIGDQIHDGTAVLNAFLVSKPHLTNTILIVSSLGIDLIGIGLLGWGLFGTSARQLAGVMVLFALRQLVQATTALPAPPGMLWRDPGFPSLLVTYSVGNDFFFSGHTAFAVFGALEFSRFGQRALTRALAVLAVCEISVVLFLRNHYTMDVITGAAMAYAVWMTLNRWWPRRVEPRG
jgi:hypothetical protein